MDEVEGWLPREAAALITATHVFQRSLSLPGSILEIGVWRGKSGILLCQLIDPDHEQCVLSDRFDGMELLEERLLLSVPVFQDLSPASIVHGIAMMSLSRSVTSEP